MAVLTKTCGDLTNSKPGFVVLILN